VNVTSFEQYTARNQVPERTQAAASEPAPFAESQAPAAPRAEQRELPRTASPMPMAGLLGLLSLGAAAGIRAFRRR
jgi:MYXO-CTERM domain-containing protein